MQIKINSEDVVHETLDGEVVIVNLRNGRYYSLADVGAEFWDLICESGDAGQLLDYARSRYQDSGEIEAAVSKFVEELAEEGLVKLSSGESDPPPSARQGPVASLPFQPPILAKHVDMEGLLLLDPVHDVSDQGWPDLKTS